MAFAASGHAIAELGGVNSAGSDRTALFLKVFSGEVLTMFENTNMTLDKHRVRTISNGKSAQFPAIGYTAAEYMTPGDALDGQAVNHNEQVITVDELLVAHQIVYELEEAMSHYDVRKEYATQNGRALAKQWDQHIMQLMVLAARVATPIVTGGNIGAQGTASDLVKTASGTLITNIFAASETFDTNDVAEEDRYVYFRPAQYNVLAQDTTVLNRDWAGAGSYADGKLLKIGGVNVVKTNNLPSTNVTADPGGTKYNGDFTKTYGVVATKATVGTVKLKELKSETEYDIRRQGNWLLSKIALGSGILRPDTAYEIRSVT